MAKRKKPDPEDEKTKRYRELKFWEFEAHCRYVDAAFELDRNRLSKNAHRSYVS